MLYIRADGNAEIGTGHIMRCLSIAAAHRKSGGDCVFITADTQITPLINQQGFSVICLDSAWDDLDQETEKMERLIAAHKIKKLLVDSYFATQDYLSRLHKSTYLIVMDDLDAFVYPCSELINYNIYADGLDYPARYPNTKLLLGSKYAPLREEFSDLPPKLIRKRVEAVLITTGGSDPFNAAWKIAKCAKMQPGLARLHLHIIAGKFNAHITKLLTLSEEYSGITVHQNVSSMSKLMQNCDIAISAGGSTLYELCACGTPTIVFSVADNQRAAVSAFADGYMLGCGDWRDGAEACLDRLVMGIFRLSDDSEYRRELSSKCRSIVDGLGANRISKNLQVHHNNG